MNVQRRQATDHKHDDHWSQLQAADGQPEQNQTERRSPRYMKPILKPLFFLCIAFLHHSLSTFSLSHLSLITSSTIPHLLAENKNPVLDPKSGAGRFNEEIGRWFCRPFPGVDRVEETFHQDDDLAVSLVEKNFRDYLIFSVPPAGDEHAKPLTRNQFNIIFLLLLLSLLSCRDWVAISPTQSCGPK